MDVVVVFGDGQLCRGPGMVCPVSVVLLSVLVFAFVLLLRGVVCFASL